MAEIFQFPKKMLIRSTKFTPEQREQLHSLASVVAGGVRGRAVVGEFDTDNDQNEVFYLMPGGGAGTAATVFFRNGGLSVFSSSDDIYGPFSDIEQVSVAVIKLLGRRSIE